MMHRYYRPRRVYRGMGGLFDPVAMPFTSDEKACLDKANGTPQVRAIDDQVTSLGRNWKPTGYFRPADIAALLAMMATEAAAAGDALAKAPRSTSDASTVIAMAFDDLKRRYQERSFVYQNALAAAQQQGANVIDAPGLKDWVIDSMRAISDAYVTATVLACRQSWIEAWLDRAYKAMVAIGAVAMRIIGVAIQVGDKVIDAATGLASLIKYIPYAAVALGAWWLYGEFKSRSR